MPITVDELTGTTTGADAGDPDTEAAEGTDSTVRIVEWVTEIPKHRRVSPFDKVVEQLREKGDSAHYAKLEWDEKNITPNKVNQLRGRFKDVEFTQVTTPNGRETYARYKGEQAPTA